MIITNFRKASKLPSPIIFFFFLFFATNSNLSVGQILTDYPCYSISEDNSPPNVLFEYDPATQLWNRVGETGGSSIEAIATDPLAGIIYAADGDTFGTIDPQTGQFSAIGSPGLASGDLGRLELRDIDGLTFDLNNQIMYASHRIAGRGAGTNDFLFQIDVATGKFVPGAMLDSNGNPADYAVVEEVFESTMNEAVYDVDDIAINPYTGKLYAIQNQDGPSTITQIDPLTGKLINVVFDIDFDDVEGLGFTYLGELYATIGDNGSTQENSNSFIFIDLDNMKTEQLIFIDPDDGVPPAEEKDFESFDCFTSFNDLALVYRLNENTPAQITPGDQVTFNITVINQGGFINENISITNYIPEGLILEDENWLSLGNKKATYTIEDNLHIGTTITIPVTFKIDENFEGNTLKSVAEISSSFSSRLGNNLTRNAVNRRITSMPDVDSTPDDIDNEINVIDNEINGNGLNSKINEDEDDHDIAIITINANSNCINSLNLDSEFLNYGVYQAGESITCQSQIIGPNIEFIAGSAIIFKDGFNVSKITSLSASIEDCR